MYVGNEWGTKGATAVNDHRCYDAHLFMGDASAIIASSLSTVAPRRRRALGREGGARGVLIVAARRTPARDIQVRDTSTTRPVEQTLSHPHPHPHARALRKRKDATTSLVIEDQLL